MQFGTFGFSAGLACLGLVACTYGILESEWKAAAFGAACFCCAAVFALFFVGLRKRKSEFSVSTATSDAASGPGSEN